MKPERWKHSLKQMILNIRNYLDSAHNILRLFIVLDGIMWDHCLLLVVKMDMLLCGNIKVCRKWILTRVESSVMRIRRILSILRNGWRRNSGVCSIIISLILRGIRIIHIWLLRGWILLFMSLTLIRMLLLRRSKRIMDR